MSRLKYKKDNNDSFKVLTQTTLEPVTDDPLFDLHFTLQTGWFTGWGSKDRIL